MDRFGIGDRVLATLPGPDDSVYTGTVTGLVLDDKAMIEVELDDPPAVVRQEWPLGPVRFEPWQLRKID